MRGAGCTYNDLIDHDIDMEVARTRSRPLPSGRVSRLQAKVFGGGNVLRGFQDPIGSRNARFVLGYLDAERIPVVGQDLGDIHPRKVAFFVQSGRTLVRRLPATRERELVDVERAYRERLLHAPASGSVELF